MKINRNDSLTESDDSSYSFSKRNAFIGKIVTWAVSLIILFYLFTLILGFISLEAPDKPIGDPYFTILELLIIVLVQLMVLSLIIVHKSTPERLKIFSLAALVFMSIMAGITSCLHFAILTLSQQESFMNKDWSLQVFSFNWPSLAYVIDILAWDFFFALSMLFLSASFKKEGLEKHIRLLLLISGILSLIGIIGIPLNNMQVRNIGIIGYTVFPIIIFFLIGFALNRRINN